MNNIEQELITTSEAFYSYHVFLFPFKWTPGSGSYNTFEEQTDLSIVNSLIMEAGNSWQPVDSWFPPKTVPQFNEINYFYDFVRTALYSDEQQSILKHYRYKTPGTIQYGIEINAKDKSYELEVDDILLHMYNTGVGVLSFHLYNRKQDQSSPQDILLINQFGRRLSPPYLGADLSNVGNDTFFNDKNWLRGLEQTKSAELASRIWLGVRDQPLFDTNFSIGSLPPQPGLLHSKFQ